MYPRECLAVILEETCSILPTFCGKLPEAHAKFGHQMCAWNVFQRTAKQAATMATDMLSLNTYNMYMFRVETIEVGTRTLQ